MDCAQAVNDGYWIGYGLGIASGLALSWGVAVLTRERRR